MISAGLEAGVALLIAIGGGLFLAGQIHQTSKHNKEDIEAIREALVEGQDSMKEMMLQNQESMMELLSKNMDDMKEMLDTQKEHQRDALEREITHLRDLITITNNETRADIQRL